jgi:hypothetical protein
MITHAGSMSAPILLGLGFVDVGRVDLLFEREAQRSPGSPES